MGFETDYKRGLRNCYWGKTLRAFTDLENVEQPDLVANLAVQALCKEWREGKLADPVQIAQVFEKSYRLLADASQLRFYISGSSDLEILGQFNRICDPLLQKLSHPPLAERMADVAYDNLCEACRDHTLFKVSSEKATETMLRNFLQARVREKLEPAEKICIHRRHQTLKQVQRRVEEVVSHLKLERVVKEMIKGKQKIIAPPKRHTKLEELMPLSLLPR